MSKKKRILYIGGFQLPDKNAAAHRVLGIGKSLRDAGYIVEYLDVSDEIKSNLLSSSWECQGFTVYSQRHASNYRQHIQYACIPLHVREILAKHDDWFAVIAYNYPSVALMKLKKICSLVAIKVIADCTEWYVFERFSLNEFLLMSDTFLRMCIVQKHLDGMIAISEYLGKYYRRYLPTVVIPPTVDLSEKKWHQVSNKLSAEDGVLRLVYAGSPGVRKDPLNKIITAIAKCSVFVQLTVVGINKKQYLETFPRDDNIINVLERNKKLVFLGRQNHVDTLKYLQYSDYAVFFRPNNRTTKAGFPTKFVEAVSCSTAVITTNSSDIRKYIGNNINGYLIDRHHYVEELSKILIDENHCVANVNTFSYTRYSETLLKLLEICR